MTDFEIITYVFSRKIYNTVKNCYFNKKTIASSGNSLFQPHEAGKRFTRYVICATTGGFTIDVPVLLKSSSRIFPFSVTIFDGNVGSGTFRFDTVVGASRKTSLTVTGSNTSVDRCLERTVEDFFI